MQRDLNEKDIKVIWDLRNDNLPEMTQYCRQSWPSVIFPLQKCNNYGMHFPTLPKFQSKSEDTSTLWIISTLLARIEPLWQRVRIFELRQSNWKVLMLMWLSKMC